MKKNLTHINRAVFILFLPSITADKMSSSHLLTLFALFAISHAALVPNLLKFIPESELRTSVDLSNNPPVAENKIVHKKPCAFERIIDVMEEMGETMAKVPEVAPMEDNLVATPITMHDKRELDDEEPLLIEEPPILTPPVEEQGVEILNDKEITFVEEAPVQGLTPYQFPKIGKATGAEEYVDLFSNKAS